MSDVISGVLSGLGGLASGAAGVYNAYVQQQMNQQNIDFQRETNAKNEALMRESWGRDDTAVQRRSADMLAAGVNPVMAAGAGAGNSGPVQMHSPSAGENPVQAGVVAASAMNDILAKQASIAQTKAQTELTKKQTENVDADVRLKLGTLQPKIDQAVADAAVAVKSVNFRINREQWNTLIAQAETAIKQDQQTSVVLANMKTSIETQIAEQKLTQAQGDAMYAVALGKMANMSADFYQSLGMSKEAVSLLTQALTGLLNIGSKLMY